MEKFGNFEKTVLVTKRETEVLEMIVKEYTNLEIGKMLFISTRTVDAHRRNILQKIGAKNTAGLVKYAVRSGIVNLDT